MYINKLDYAVNKCNNRCHSTIKRNPVDINSSAFIDSSKEINDKDRKFKVGDFVKK